MELINNLVRTLEHEKIHYFGLFVGLAKEKNINIDAPLPHAPPDDALHELLELKK